MPAPLDLRWAVGLVREARSPSPAARPVLVSGPRADELVRALSHNGRPGLVRAGTGDDASVLVRVLAGPPAGDDVDVLRRATRAMVPAVVVQTGDWTGRVPYVGAADVVDVPPGAPLPVEAVARAVARAAGDDGVALAAGLPVLVEPVQAVLIARTAAAAALVAGTPVGGRAHLPVIATAQTRMLDGLRRTRGQELDGADPQALAGVVAPELGLPLLAGTAARAAVRHLPAGGAPLRAAVAAAVTIGLGVLATRFADRLPGA